MPPLKALRAFEAVLRCGGISAAAEDMCVTHGAISKQITQLENWFGRSLFFRTASGIRPMPETLAFAQEIREAFDGMRRACDGLKASQSEQQELQILAPATFAMQWLVPKLSKFSVQKNSAPVRVQTSQSTDDWRKFSFDVAIRRNFEPTKGYRSAPLLAETLVLVATPAVGRALQEGGLDSLSQTTLLSSDTRPNELERWLEAAGLPPQDNFRRQRFGHFYVLLQAVLNDFGPAVAPLPVLAQEIMAGRLMSPFPDIAIPGVTYSAVVPPACENRTDVKAFIRWIEQEREESDKTFATFLRHSQSPSTICLSGA